MGKINITDYIAGRSTYLCVHVHQTGEGWEVKLSGVGEDPREGTEKREEVPRRG